MCTTRNVITVVITLGTMAAINTVIIVVVCIICYFQYTVLVITPNINKKKYTNEMPSIWRKASCLNTTTIDFEFAKDIRLYNMHKLLKKISFEVNNEGHIIKKMYNRLIICTTGINFLHYYKTLFCIYGWCIVFCLPE